MEGEMNKKNEAESMSLSKQRKLEREKEIRRSKKSKAVSRIIIVAVIVVVIGLIGWGVGRSIYKSAHTVKSSADFSAQLNEDGTIKGVKASDYVSLCDYKNIVTEAADLEYSDEEVEADIMAELEEHKQLNTLTTAGIADGDTVNIDYAGAIDGVEFDGGTAQGADLEIGSGQFIPGFEEQLIGHSAGESFDISVTFPEDYSVNPDLAGEEAVFSITVNGIYELPEFNDEFVTAYLSEHADTADGYRQYLKDVNYSDNLTEFVRDYITEYSTVSSYPQKYLNQLKSTYKYTDESYYQYMNSMYTQYYGQAMYTGFADYITKNYNMTEEEYDENLTDTVAPTADLCLICQAIAEAEGITANLDDARAYMLENGSTEEDFENQAATYGNGYLVQNSLCNKVINMICELVKVQ